MTHRALFGSLVPTMCNHKSEGGHIVIKIAYILRFLASVRFEHSLCRASLMTTYITLLALLLKHSLVHYYQQCVTVHMFPSACVATKPLW